MQQNNLFSFTETKKKSAQDLKKIDESFVLERPQIFNNLLNTLITPTQSSDSLLYNVSSGTTVGEFLAFNSTQSYLNCKYHIFIFFYYFILALKSLSSGSKSAFSLNASCAEKIKPLTNTIGLNSLISPSILSNLNNNNNKNNELIKDDNLLLNLFENKK